MSFTEQYSLPWYRPAKRVILRWAAGRDVLYRWLVQTNVEIWLLKSKSVRGLPTRSEDPESAQRCSMDNYRLYYHQSTLVPQ